VTREKRKAGIPSGQSAVRWRVWPLLEDSRKALLAVGALILFPALFAWSTHSTGWGLLSFLLLLASISTFLFPTHYSVDAEWVEWRHLGLRYRKRRKDFQRVLLLPEGVLFSPFPRPSFLERYRGVYFRFPGGKNSNFSPDALSHLLQSESSEPT